MYLHHVHLVFSNYEHICNELWDTVKLMNDKTEFDIYIRYAP